GLTALVLLGVYLAYLVLRPFFTALTWAVVFAILFYGMQSALVRRMSPGGAAGLVTVLVGLGIAAPAMLIVATLAREIPQAGDQLNAASQSRTPQAQRTWDAIRARSPVELPENPAALVGTAQQRTIAFLNSHATGFATDALAAVGNLGMMLVALFFFLRDGEVLNRRLLALLPLSESCSERLASHTRARRAATGGA